MLFALTQRNTNTSQRLCIFGLYGAIQMLLLLLLLFRGRELGHKKRYINSTFLLFTALHAIQTRSSRENSVRPCVRLPVKRVICDKIEEKSVQVLYHTKDHLA